MTRKTATKNDAPMIKMIGAKVMITRACHCEETIDVPYMPDTINFAIVVDQAQRERCDKHKEK